MKCSIERRGLTYQAVVVSDGRPRVTTRITTLTRKGAERALVAEGCSDFGRVRGRSLRDGAPAAPAPVPAAPVAKPIAGLPSWWPFKKKPAKQLDRDPRRMAQTIMIVPGKKSGEFVQMRGAKRKRRRR